MLWLSFTPPLEIQKLPAIASLDCQVYMSFACFGLHLAFCSLGISHIWSVELRWLPRLRRMGSMRGAVPLGLLSQHTHGREPVCTWAAALRALWGYLCMCLEHETLVWCPRACCRQGRKRVSKEVANNWYLVGLCNLTLSPWFSMCIITKIRQSF